MPGTSKKVALGGVLGALCIICLYLAVYLPTSRLFFYGVSSVFSSIMLVESGNRWAWIFYFATSLLALLLIPNKVGIIPYAAFFGLYGMIKYYIEGIRNTAIELILKGAFFSLGLFLAILVVKELFMGEVFSKLPLWALIIGALVVFYIYDYAYTQFVVFYETRIRKRI